jgi:hypothetical protein
MRINQAELERRLQSPNNLTRSLPGSTVTVYVPDNDNVTFEKKEPRPYAKEPSLPTETKILAGSMVRQGLPAKDVADSLSITVGQVNSAKNSKDPRVQAAINYSLERVQELAIDKLMQAMGLMTIEKFETASLKDLSIVSANMSRIIEKTRVQEDGTRIQLVIYAPEMRKQSGYKMLDVA